VRQLIQAENARLEGCCAPSRFTLQTRRQAARKGARVPPGEGVSRGAAPASADHAEQIQLSADHLFAASRAVSNLAVSNMALTSGRSDPKESKASSNSQQKFIAAQRFSSHAPAQVARRAAGFLILGNGLWPSCQLGAGSRH